MVSVAAPKVALVCMPFQSCVAPSVALGTLKAVLERAGISSKVYYLNLDYLRWVADDPSEALERCGRLGTRQNQLVGDWVFSPQGSPASDARYLEALRGSTIPEGDVDLLLGLRARSGEFIDRCAQRILAGGHDIVGLTVSYMQTRASIALATAVKHLLPATRIVFGGPNAFYEMGSALIDGFDVVDVVCHGEADELIVPLVRALRGEGGFSLEGIRGISYRDQGEVRGCPESRNPDIEDVPLPDHGDYFDQIVELEKSWGTEVGLPYWMPLETARGCWWGARRTCSFCGLNSGQQDFRARTPDRVVRDIRRLHDAWKVSKFFVVDTIMDQRYFDGLLPLLAERKEGFQFFWELRPNLTRRQVAALEAAGVTDVQPGIESLSTPVLRMMNKGVTAIQNVQALKWLSEHSIGVVWNYLVNIPGERIEWLEDALRLIPRLFHLPPPLGLYPIQVRRFSPYHTAPERFGLRLEGPDLYSHLVYHDLPPQHLRRLAPCFEYTIPDRDPAVDVLISSRLRPLLDEWTSRYEARGCTLSVVHGPEESLLVEGPFFGPEQLSKISGSLARLLRSCEAVRSERRLAGILGGFDTSSSPRTDVARLRPREYRILVERLEAISAAPAEEITLEGSPEEIFDCAEAMGLVMREDGRILGLPVNHTASSQSMRAQYGLHLAALTGADGLDAAIG